MNRLHHLKETLIENIPLVEKFDNVELIILNYGSTDGMHYWCKDNLKNQINSGRVKYFYTEKPKQFLHSHAKNIAHKKANGDILINLDADNYIVEGYIEFVLECFEKQNCIIASPPLDHFGKPGCFGKIAVKKQTFYEIGGYEEKIDYGWAWEDNHLINRILWNYGIPIIMTDSKLCKTIEHDDEDRIKYCKGKNMEHNKQLTMNMLQESNLKKEYVANKNNSWGYIDELYDFNLELVAI
jgi:glycosyltransferase involved in cell wall biosynthesis